MLAKVWQMLTSGRANLSKALVWFSANQGYFVIGLVAVVVAIAELANEQLVSSRQFIRYFSLPQKTSTQLLDDIATRALVPYLGSTGDTQTVWKVLTPREEFPIRLSLDYRSAERSLAALSDVRPASAERWSLRQNSVREAYEDYLYDLWEDTKLKRGVSSELDRAVQLYFAGQRGTSHSAPVSNTGKRMLQIRAILTRLLLRQPKVDDEIEGAMTDYMSSAPPKALGVYGTKVYPDVSSHPSLAQWWQQDSKFKIHFEGPATLCSFSASADPQCQTYVASVTYGPLGLFQFDRGKWFREELLDKYRLQGYQTIEGRQFFGPRGNLSVIPAAVLVGRKPTLTIQVQDDLSRLVPKPSEVQQWDLSIDGSVFHLGPITKRTGTKQSVWVLSYPSTLPNVVAVVCREH
jgi:hypothetical protein